MNRTTDRMPPQIRIHLKALSIAACESLPSSVMPACLWICLSAEGTTASLGISWQAGTWHGAADAQAKLQDDISADTSAAYAGLLAC